MPFHKREGDNGDMGSQMGRAHLLRAGRRAGSGWLQGWEPVERLNRQLVHVEVDAAARSLVRGPGPPAGNNEEGGTRDVTRKPG